MEYGWESPFGEFMAKTGKTLNQLIDEVYAITGTVWFERNDLHISDAIKEKVLANCKSGAYNKRLVNTKCSVLMISGWL